MTMSAKDHKLIADAVAEAGCEAGGGSDDYCGVELVARRLADALRLDNPRFSPERFLEACGVTP